MNLSRRAFVIGCLGVAALPQLALPARAAEVAVTIKGMKFNPARISVKVGDTVTFTNADGAPHSATADDKSFDTGRLAKGQSASVKFTKAGDVAFHCMVHPSMKGIVQVT